MFTPADIPDDLSMLDGFLADQESQYNLKPGTKAQVLWHGEKQHRQTSLSLVYLHGFKASHPEGDPTHRSIADFLGANLFLSRLQEHGLASEVPLRDLTEQKLLESAESALTLGQKIGKQVVLMGTSTGGSLALYLAAQPEFQPVIAGLILYSPLIRFYGLNDILLQSSFLRPLLGLIPGKSFRLRTPGTTEAEDRIWNATYALQGALALGAFTRHHMQPELFNKIRCPVFTGYYYKNKEHQDKVVSVAAIKKMISQLGSDPPINQSANFPDAGSHVICSSLTSEAVPAVIAKTEAFLKSVDMHTDSPKEMI